MCMFFLFFQREDGLYLHEDLKVLLLVHGDLLPMLCIRNSAFIQLYS